MTDLPGRLLISGVPGAGKTYFVDWLGKTHGFSVIKADDGGARFNAIWRAARCGLLAMPVVNSLGPRLVIELGFVPDDYHLGGIRNFIKARFDAWWFSADYPDALQAWRQARSGTDDVNGFYLQSGRIVSHWPQIATLFRGRIIQTIQNGVHMAPQHIADVIARVRAEN